MEPTIRNLARERFLLGRPPRKNNDTSIGDALNWEWIIECAKQNKNSHIILISTDQDYGIIKGKDSFLNDYLNQEFKLRTKNSNKVIFTQSLSDGLKRLSITVSKAVEKAEEKSIKNNYYWATTHPATTWTSSSSSTSSNPWISAPSSGWSTIPSSGWSTTPSSGWSTTSSSSSFSPDTWFTIDDDLDGEDNSKKGQDK